MTLPQHKSKRPANTQLAGSAHWYDLPTPTLQAWLDEYRVTRTKHTPAIERVSAVCAYLASRQRNKQGFQESVIQETEKQIANGVKFSLGSVADVIAFLDWLGVLPTLRSGGQGVATTRQLLRPEFSLRRDNPVPNETERNGKQAERNGETHRTQRALPRYSKSPRDQAPTPPPNRASAVEMNNQVRVKCRECHDTGYKQEHAPNSGWTQTTNPCSKGCDVPDDEFAGMSEQEIQAATQAALDDARAHRNKLAEKQNDPARWLVR